MPPRATTRYAFLPPRRPADPLSVYLKVGRLELADQGVGIVDDRLLLGRALAGLGEERAEARGVEVGYRVFRGG